MFDIGWSELFVIAVVAVVVVGPKELPRMLRTFGGFVARVKRMAGDFQRQFTEAIREAELDEVQKSIQDISKIDPVGEIRQSMEPVASEISRDLNKAVDDANAAMNEPKPAAEPVTALSPPMEGAEAPAPEQAAPEKPPEPVGGVRA